MAIFLSGDYVRNLQTAGVHHVVISALSASARFTTTMQSFVKMGDASAYESWEIGAYIQKCTVHNDGAHLF